MASLWGGRWCWVAGAGGSRDADGPELHAHARPDRPGGLRDRVLPGALAGAAHHDQVAVAGDFNIAPEDRDVHDPKAWEGSVLVSERERAAFKALCGLGLIDSFRLFDQPEQSYSWWDYRQAAFRRNRGLRIDHILMSQALAKRCKGVHIDAAPRAWPRPSDHTPVVAEID